MKRIILIFLMLTLALSGCGNSPSSVKMPDEEPGASGGEITESAAGLSDDANGDTENVIPDAADAGDDVPSDIDVDITEKMYVTYINEIYVNTEDYIGETIRIQGMFQAYKDDNTGQTYYYVYRTGPGCCGNDGSMCGFEFTWGEDMPEEDDWIEVVGSLRTYEEDGWSYLTLDAKSVTVMEERGAETVYQ